jgi:hypothetical protein
MFMNPFNAPRPQDVRISRKRPKKPISPTGTAQTAISGPVAGVGDAPIETVLSRLSRAQSTGANNSPYPSAIKRVSKSNKGAFANKGAKSTKVTSLGNNTKASKTNHASFGESSSDANRPGSMSFNVPTVGDGNTSALSDVKRDANNNAKTNNKNKNSNISSNKNNYHNSLANNNPNKSTGNNFASYDYSWTSPTINNLLPMHTPSMGSSSSPYDNTTTYTSSNNYASSNAYPASNGGIANTMNMASPAIAYSVNNMGSPTSMSSDATMGSPPSMGSSTSPYARPMRHEAMPSPSASLKVFIQDPKGAAFPQHSRSIPAAFTGTSSSSSAAYTGTSTSLPPSAKTAYTAKSTSSSAYAGLTERSEAALTAGSRITRLLANSATVRPYRLEEVRLSLSQHLKASQINGKNRALPGQNHTALRQNHTAFSPQVPHSAKSHIATMSMLFESDAVCFPTSPVASHCTVERPSVASHSTHDRPSLSSRATEIGESSRRATTLTSS